MKLFKDYKNLTNSANSAFLPSLGGSIKLKVIFISVFLLGALISTQLVFANSLATDGGKLSEVREQIKNLEQENMYLEGQIAQESSLVKLSEKAQKDGFIKPKVQTSVP